MEQADKSDQTALMDIAQLFLRLGTTAFGGPAAHVAMMQHEVVERRKWMSRGEFLDLLGATNLIPGPNSTEMAIHIGHRRRGWPGLLVAGASFIFPAMVIVTLFAWAYVRYGSLPQVSAILYGVKPVIIAIVVQALWVLGRRAMKTVFLAGVFIVGVSLTLLGVHELLVLFGGGLVIAAPSLLLQRDRLRSLSVVSLALMVAEASPAAFGMWWLFLFFLKVGSVLYGSGYVLLAFIRADLVERWHWLSESQLIDAIAVGQVTPGPVFTTATFIGYLLGGFRGSVVATVGIFLPAFVFVGLSGPLVPRIRRSAVAGSFLDGVNAAALSLMSVVTFQLARAAIVDTTTILLAIISAVILVRFKVNSAWLVLAGALVGWFLR